jgi:hypothetical protein
LAVPLSPLSIRDSRDRKIGDMSHAQLELQRRVWGVIAVIIAKAFEVLIQHQKSVLGDPGHRKSMLYSATIKDSCDLSEPFTSVLPNAVSELIVAVELLTR